MNEKNKAAIYLRISREDGDMGESGSISNQRQLLMSFLSEREDLEFSGEYVDDGVSGYQFNRPGFNRMMQDARQKNICKEYFPILGFVLLPSTIVITAAGK